MRDPLRDEMRETTRLAIPVVLTQLSMMGMGVVDTLMVGRLGPVALASVSIGHTVQISTGLALMGVIMGIEPLIGQAFGGGQRRDCGKTLWQGIWLALLFGVPLSWVLHDFGWGLRLLRQQPEVVEQGAIYLSGRAWAFTPFLVFAAHRFFLNAVGSPRRVLVVAIVANVVNFVADYALIFGNLGAPRLGIFGAGLATTASQLTMAALAVACVFAGGYRDLGVDRLRWPDRARLRRIAAVGVPVGLHLAAEVGVFAMTGVLAGWIGKIPQAAHQVALTLASLTFMVPLGVSVAASVRVSQLIGADDRDGAARAGRFSLVLGTGFMMVSATAFLIFAEPLVRLFTDDADVVALGGTLVRIAGAFQVFDALQVVASGCLRGAADTRVPMLVNLVAHWGVGLPLGYALAFHAGWGAAGLWVGLTSSLAIVGVVLVRRFLRGAWR